LKTSIIVAGVIVGIIGMILLLFYTVYPYPIIGMIVLLIGNTIVHAAIAYTSEGAAVESETPIYHELNVEELRKEEDLRKKHSTDPEEPLISALITKWEREHILYPRAYLERKIQYKMNVRGTRDQAIKDLYSEEIKNEK
jgi:hypothetical protein